MNMLQLIKALSFLACTILLIYFCFYLIKKKMNSKFSGRAPRIRLLEQKRLDQKLSVSVLSIDGKKFLIASSASAIAIKNLGTETTKSAYRPSQVSLEHEVH